MNQIPEWRSKAKPGQTLAEAKAMSAEAINWLKGGDLPDSSQGATLVNPYQQSAWVYTAISALAENLAHIPFRISRVGGGKARRVQALRGSADPEHRQFCHRALAGSIVESGDVVDLFACPHPTMDQAQFWTQLVSWLCLRGEFFILPLDEQDNAVNLGDRSPRVRRLITLEPTMFWHLVIGYRLEGWRYTGSPLMSPIPSEVLLPSEVIHAKMMNPYLYWRGMSPLSVAMLPAMADYAAEMFMKGLLMNNADTGIIATTEQNLTPEQREQFMAALRERKRKAGTPDRPLFLSSGVKIEKPTISNVDMQFLETRKLLRQEIGAIFRVPESVMGFSESKSSSLSGGGNALSEEKMTFIEQCITPKCHMIESALAPVVRTFGEDLLGWFDIEGLPIMQDARRMRVETATKVFALGVPFNEINKVYNLGFRDLPWGNTGYLAFNLQPADQMGAPEPSEQPGGETPESAEGAEDKDPVKAGLKFLRLLGKQETVPAGKSSSAAALWRKHMRSRAASVKQVKSKITRVLNEFRATALSKLEQHYKSMAAEKRGLVDVLFNATEFGNALKLVTEAPLRSAVETASSELLAEVGSVDPWKFPPQSVLEYITGRSFALAKVGETARSQINTTLTEGVEAGETAAQLADRVRGSFNNLAQFEAERIARTEVNMAFNFSRHETMVGVGIEYKSWLSSHGPHVRPAHAEAEEVYLNAPIPVDEPFEVDGEQLMYPGDDSGSAGNVINCQCVSIAAEKAQEDEKGATYLLFGIGKQTFAHESH